MNTILKRVISMMLCFVMLAGYLPVGALAEEIAPVQEPSADPVIVVEEEAADAEAAVLAISEPEWVLPDCDCGNTEAELGSHGETCARKVFLEEFCQETAADIFAKWENLPEDCQKYILEYLGKDETNAEKLAELNGYVNAAQVASDENEDNTDGAEGNTDGTEGNTDGTEGNTDGTEGNTDGTEGNTDGTEGNTDGTEGNTDGAEDNNDEIQNTEDGTEENEDTTEEENLDAVLENAVLSVDRGGEKPLAVVYAASDFQKTTTNSSGNKTDDVSGGKKIMNNIIAQMTAAGYEKGSDFAVTGALFCGDYTGTYNTWNKTTTAGSTGHKATSQPYANAGANAVEAVLSEAWGLTDEKVIYVQGNHDYEFDNMDPSGANDTEHYGVYVLHEDDFQWKQGDPTTSGNGSSNDARAVTQATANALEAYLKAKLEAKDNRPILIASHVPLHFGYRTTSAKNGDNMYANLIFDVINEYANKGLNIIFLFGHNHSSTYDDYLGGTAVYLRPGDQMEVPQSKNSDPATKTLAFTYMNAGYVGYESSACTPATLTSSVLEIYEDKVIVSRYDAKGLTYLQNTGVEDSSGITPDSTHVVGEDTITLKTFHADLDLGTLKSGRMIVGNAGDLTVKGVYNTAYNVTWTSSDDAIVSVTPSADGMSATVTANGVGTATVTAVATEAARAVGDQVTLNHTIEVVESAASAGVPLVEAGTEYSFFKKVDAPKMGKIYMIVDMENGAPVIGRHEALHYNRKVDEDKEADKIYSDNSVAARQEVNASGEDVFQLPINGTVETMAVSTSKNVHWLLDLNPDDSDENDFYIKTQNASEATYVYLSASEGDTSSSNLYNDYYASDADHDQLRMTNAGDSVGGNAWIWNSQLGLHSAEKADKFNYVLYYSQAQTDYSTYRYDADGDAGLLTETADSRVYLFEETTVTLNNTISAYLDDVTGYVNKDVGYKDDDGKLLGYTQTGDKIIISDGTATLEVPVTIDMLSGDININAAGTYTGLTVTYAGVAICENYTLVVNNTATLMKNGTVANGAAVEYMDTIYTLVEKMRPNRQYLIVDSNEAGIAHAMGMLDADNASAHNVQIMQLPVDGKEMLLIDADRYSDEADETTAGLVGRGIREQGDINAYLYDQSTEAADYAAAVNLVWSTTQRAFPYKVNPSPEYYQVANTAYYILEHEYQNEYLRIRLNSSDASAEDLAIGLVGAGNLNDRAYWTYDAGGVHLDPNAWSHAYLFYNFQNIISNARGNTAAKNFQVEETSVTNSGVTYSGLNQYRRTWIYERVTNIDTISARVSDKSTTVVARTENSQATNGSTFTGDYILVDTTHTNGTVTTQQVPINISMLSGNYDLTAAGTYPNLTVNYQGVAVCSDYTLIVNNFVPNDYPEFPDEGAVRVDKQLDTTKYDYLETGIASIDLSVTGIPAQTGVDLVVILDASSSMNKCVHSVAVGKKCDTCGDITNANTRMAVMENTLEDMLETLQEPIGGYTPDVDVAVATFNGYTVINSDYELYYDGGSNAGYESSQQANEDKPDAAQILMPFTNIADVNPKALNQSTNMEITINRGTNYDRGMELAYDLLEAKQKQNALEGVARQAVVVFMSDGAAYQYNYFQGDASMSYWNDYLVGTLTTSSTCVTKQSAAVQSVFAKYYNGNGTSNKHWMAEAIKGDPNVKHKIIDPDAMTADHITYVNGLGATLYTVGFGLGKDDTVTADTCIKNLTNMASTASHYLPANNNAQLEAAFSKIAGEVRQAGNAVFKDQMGKNFDLVFSNEIHIINDEGQPEVVDLTENPPTITVKSYALYKRSEIGTKVGDVWVTETMVGSRKPGDPTVLETITFNVDGTVISSDKKTGNILNGKVIEAATFWYNTDETNAQNITVGGKTVSLESESFYWNVGSIPEDELVLSYSVYLDGSMEGTRPEGTYDTNEFARLTYTNYLGNECKLETVSPKLPWQQGTVGYAFYLVNSKGEPIINQSNGTIGSFEQSVKITQPVYKDFYMNSKGEDLIAETITAAHVMPEGYTLFDTGAAYEVLLDSDGNGFYKITKGDAVDVETTYVQGIASTAILGTGRVDTDNYTTANTVVWFAVTATVQCAPDTVVIDYGLPVEIDVRANDVMMGDFGKLMYLDRADNHESGEMKLWEYLQTVPVNKTSQFSTAAVDGDNGKASVVYTADVNGKVRYALNESNGMQMKEEETFVYAVNYTGNVGTQGYYYSTVTVIPATTIYYEDEFVTLTTETKGAAGWTADDPAAWTQVGSETDATQAEDRPGEYSLSQIDANNVYGYDAAYSNMSEYSLGSAAMANVYSGHRAKATFEFYGTGFDVISVTSNKTGTITVSAYPWDDAANAYSTEPSQSYVVDTYYGYTRNSDGEWVVDNSTSDNALYQVPVMKISGLTYGKYKAEIVAAYSTMFDHDQYDNDSYDFYLDAIRIYDPANNGAGNQVIENAYKADGEGWPTYFEVRNKIIDQATADQLGNEAAEGIVFIDGEPANKVVSDYQNFGPNNETYLAAGQAIAFELSDAAAAKIQLAVKTVGGSASVKVYSTDGDVALDEEINTATDMYHDITAMNGKTVVIMNDGESGILSITNVKTTYAAAPTATTKFLLRRATVDAALATMHVEEEVPETTEPSVPETNVPEETKPAKPDNSELKAAVEAAKQLKAKDYTQASFKKLETAIKAADQVLKDKKSTQAQIDKALADLNAAVENLEAIPDNSELKAAVEEAKKIKQKGHTHASFQNLQNAIKAADKVLKDKKATQAQIDKALADLNAAVDALETAEVKPINPKPGASDDKFQNHFMGLDSIMNIFRNMLKGFKK